MYTENSASYRAFLGMCCMKLWLFYKGRKMSKNQGIAAAGGQVWRSFSPTSCSVQGQTRAGCSGSRPVRIRVFPKTVHSLSRQTVLTLDHLTIKRGFSINFFLIFKLIFLFFSVCVHWKTLRRVWIQLLHSSTADAYVQHWPEQQPQGCTTSVWPPAGLCAADHNPFSSAAEPLFNPPHCLLI